MVLGSGVGVSAVEGADGGDWEEQREAQGAAEGEAVRGRSGSGCRRWETSCWRLKDSSPF